VQDLLGHSSIALTLGTYSHVTPRMHDEAALAMQQVLFDSPADDPAKTYRQRRRTTKDDTE